METTTGKDDKRDPRMAAIIERIEALRQALKLNKAQFCAAFGMRPQTYNNFIGAQGSKPNVELVLGVCSAHGVRPQWLLFGVEPMFEAGMLESDHPWPGPGVPIPVGTGEFTDRVTELERFRVAFERWAGSGWPGVDAIMGDTGQWGAAPQRAQGTANGGE